MAEAYRDLIMDNVEEVNRNQMKALDKIESNKARASQYYDKKVRAKSFQEGDFI